MVDRVFTKAEILDIIGEREKRLGSVNVGEYTLEEDTAIMNRNMLRATQRQALAKLVEDSK
jgi:hypothetical protein